MLEYIGFTLKTDKSGTHNSRIKARINLNYFKLSALVMSFKQFTFHCYGLLFSLTFIEAILYRDHVAGPIDDSTLKRPKCLDGSDAVYYHSSNEETDIKDILIYLQPGGYCHNIETCRFRCTVAPYMCTAPQHENMSQLEGILSDDHDKNPSLWNFYKMVIPYCSGDMFTGKASPFRVEESAGGFFFHGRYMLETIITRMREQGLLGSVRRVVLAGSSAGGAGVALNCNYIASLLGIAIYTSCIVDGAFFYPVSEPMHPNPTSESIDAVLEEGARLWAAPDIAKFELHGAWWDTIGHPLLITTAVVDQFGFQSYCGDTNNETDINIWTTGVVAKTAALSQNVSIFMPSCYDHMLLIDDDVYNEVKVKVKVGNRSRDRMTLAHVINMWLDGHVTVKAIDSCEDNDVLCNSDCPHNILTYWQMTNYGFH